MKILLVNTHDNSGGAARAVYRLHQGLQRVGLESKMMVKYKKTTDPSVVCHSSSLINSSWGKYLVPDLLPLVLYPRRRKLVSWGVGWLDNDTPQRALSQNPELIHLHWVCKGFVSIRGLANLSTPIVWTLHDMWAFTGGCHYSEDCTRYTEACGSCPQLGSRRENDLSRRIWNLKKRYWKDINLTFVTPSRWLGDCVKASSLFHSHPVKVIPNGLNTSLFSPRDRETARKRFELPLDRKIILAGALNAFSDKKKGLHLLVPGLKRLLKESLDLDVQLAVFGEPKIRKSPEFGVPTTYIGRIDDDSELAALYSAADVFVAPSPQEAFCQTVSEAAACGTPSVAFAGSGVTDIIDHKKTGYLARSLDIEDLAYGITWILEDDERRRTLGIRARQKAESEFGLLKVASQYKELYETLLTSQTGFRG